MALSPLATSTPSTAPVWRPGPSSKKIAECSLVSVVHLSSVEAKNYKPRRKASMHTLAEVLLAKLPSQRRSTNERTHNVRALRSSPAHPRSVNRDPKEGLEGWALRLRICG